MEKITLPIHFEDRSGTEFERLVFAYISRIKNWSRIEWLGQTGSDGERDIWGIFSGESFCYQCANYQKLNFEKIRKDIDKLVDKQTLPDHFIVVCGGTISAQTRSRIIDYSTRASIKTTEVWSSIEFEEKLRADTPELIKRFFEGVEFPDSPSQLIGLANLSVATNDKEIVDLLLECLDRPAFTTRFQDEVCIDNFEKALTDTIEVFNTGIHRLRDGTEIRRIPSRHQIQDRLLKDQLAEITKWIVFLRSNYISLKRSGDIKPCGCGNINCSVMFLSEKACEIMNESRTLILEQFRQLKPGFQIWIY